MGCQRFSRHSAIAKKVTIFENIPKLFKGVFIFYPICKNIPHPFKFVHHNTNSIDSRSVVEIPSVHIIMHYKDAENGSWMFTLIYTPISFQFQHHLYLDS